MVDRGMSATSAATRLRMAITMMSAPSKQAAKILTDMGLSAKDAQDQTSNFAVVLKQAGVTTTQLAEDMRTKGLNATLHELKDRLTTVTGSSALAEAALTKAFGGAKSATSIQLLTDNLGAYDSKLAKINSTTGEFDKSAVDASKTLNNQFHTAVSKVQAALLQAFNPDNHQFDGLGKGISDVGNAITGIINKFAALSPHTQETIIKVLALTAALGPVLWTGGKIIGVFEGFAKIFGGAKVAVEFLVEHGLKPFELIGKVVTTVWTFVAETVIPLVIDGFIALAAAIGVSVGWLIVIVLAIIAVGVAIYELVTHWKQVSKFIMDIWKVVADWLVKTWKGITTEASKAFNAVKKVVIDVMTAIVKAVVAYLDLVTYPFRLALALILAIVIFAFKVIVGSIVIAMTAIYNFVAPILVRIYNFYAGIFTSIYNFLAGIMQAISNFIVSIWNKVYNFYAGILQAISNVIVSAWNAVYKFISGVLQAISNFIVGVWNSIYNTVARIMQGIWNVLVGVWNSIANAISGTINWIMRMVGGVGGGIINTLAGAGGWLVNAGSNVIRGLWNGIAGMAGWLYNNVMGFIRNNVPGPVLKLLGIRSPSTLFAEYGKNTMMGFHQGFMSQGDATQKTTTQVFQTLVNNSKNALGKLTTDMKNMSTLSAAQKGQGGVTQNALSPGANSNTSNTNQKTQLFAPVININMGGGGSAGDMTYAAKQAVLAMQNKALFT
jgi:phage-related protein